LLALAPAHWSLLDPAGRVLDQSITSALLSQMAKLAKTGGVQLIIATHSPIIPTFPGASILAFDGARIEPFDSRIPLSLGPGADV
jgi:predicted ATPase